MTTLTVNENSSEKYPPRTYYNAKSSDITLALAVDLSTAGEKLTHNAAGKEKYLGFLLENDITPLDVARKLYKKMKESNATKLNIAGNGIYTLRKANTTQEQINQFVYEVIAQVHQFHPIEKIYTGGQTGVDIAGAVAGVALGIPTEVTLPKGFKQRFDKEDINQSREIIEEQINTGAKNLLSFDLILKKQPPKP